LVVSWSDESDSDGESESAKHVTALTGVCTSDVESDDGILSYEDLLATYKELYEKDLEICKTLQKQKKTISQLMTERDEGLKKISELTNEAAHLNSQLDNTMKQVRILNTGTTVLEEILGSQDQRKGQGIGFNYKTVNNSQGKKIEKFVPAKCDYNPTTGTQMLKRPTQHHGSTSRRKPRRWVCHHCGMKGHIRPYCFKLYGYPKWYQ
jgi:hypothetical protein